MINDESQNASQRRLTLRKSEKLRHRQFVGELFTSGKNLYDFPIRMTWRVLTKEQLDSAFRSELPPNIGKLQMMITVPKKKRRKAVDRVLLRRRLREAYRLNRLNLSDYIAGRDDIAALHLAFIYLGDENIEYAEAEKKMISLLNRLQKKLTFISPE